MPLPFGAVKRATIGKIPLFYERRSTTDVWGDLALNEAFSGHFDREFAEDADEVFSTLYEDGFIPKPAGIITAGAFVEKPGGHGLARALDLDGLVWSPDSPSPIGLMNKWKATMYSTPAEKKFYCGLMCHFSLKFGNVLGWEYNNAHKDHIHMDDLIRPEFRYNSHSVVSTIQSSIAYIQGEGIHIDGEWGPATRTAMVRVVPFTGIYPTNDQYFDFLKKMRSLAFLGIKPAVVLSPPKKMPTIEERVERIERYLRDTLSSEDLRNYYFNE